MIIQRGGIGEKKVLLILSEIRVCAVAGHMLQLATWKAFTRLLTASLVCFLSNNFLTVIMIA